MSKIRQPKIGVVKSLWRYPVKSMLGEGVSLVQVHQFGFYGDRVYGLVDTSDGKVATAKNPQKWPDLFSCRARLMETSGASSVIPPVCITLPDGSVVTSDVRDLDQTLSRAMKRGVTLAVTQAGRVSGVQTPLSVAWTGQSEEYWPDMEGREHQNTVTDFSLPSGTFFDGAMVHMLTTATLNRLQALYPMGCVDLRRFRPNLVVETVVGQEGFVENSWMGCTVGIGEEVRMKITAPCGRCVMTTLAQEGLPKDAGILRTAVQHNHGHVGVYATVVQGGAIRCGDEISVEI